MQQRPAMPMVPLGGHGQGTARHGGGCRAPKVRWSIFRGPKLDTYSKRAAAPFPWTTAAARSLWRLARLATSIRQVTRDQMEPGPAEFDTGRSWFLLSPEQILPSGAWYGAYSE